MTIQEIEAKIAELGKQQAGIYEKLSIASEALGVILADSVTPEEVAAGITTVIIKESERDVFNKHLTNIEQYKKQMEDIQKQLQGLDAQLEELKNQAVQPTTLKCPKCGNPVSENHVFCAVCGEKLGAPQPSQPPKSTGKRFCPICDTELAEDVLFCHICGHKLGGK